MDTTALDQLFSFGNELSSATASGLRIALVAVLAWLVSAIVIRCRFRVAPLEQWNVPREYLKRLKAAFDREDIEIPYPHLRIVQA